MILVRGEEGANEGGSGAGPAGGTRSSREGGISGRRVEVGADGVLIEEIIKQNEN